MKLKLRPWKESDAAFVCYVRNNPELMQWFRQNKPITLQQQKLYMRSNLLYCGYILEDGGVPVGVFALHKHVHTLPELCIAAPLKYHNKGLSLLLKEEPFSSDIHAEVMIDNPALLTYLNMGFTPIMVCERAYFKSDRGNVDTLVLNYENPYFKS